MKMILKLLRVLAMMLAAILLTSCAVPNIETQSNIETIFESNNYDTQIGSLTEIMNNSETNQSIPKEEIHYYPHNNPGVQDSQMVRTKNRIYFGGYYKMYYDMYNQELYSLCFDPLCEHNSMSCITQKFINMFDYVVNEYNSRIYVVRGDNIFSFTIMGSDIKLEVSFSDKGKDLNSFFFESVNIRNLTYFDNYIFFERYEIIDEETRMAVPSIYRYNVENKELLNLSELNNYEYAHILAVYGDNQIIIRLVDESLENSSYYLCDFYGKIIKALPNYLGYRFFDGKYFYQLEQSKIISQYDLEGNKNIILQSDEKISILDLYDGYIYYLIYDSNPFFVGSYEIYNTRKKEWETINVYNSVHTVGRVSIETKEEEIIFEGLISDDPKDISYSVGNIMVLGNDILMQGCAKQENEETHHIVNDKNVPLAYGWCIYHLNENNKLEFYKALLDGSRIDMMN